MTTWNYTVQDFSPLFLYYAAPDGGSRQVPNLNPAWIQSCPFAPSGPLNNFYCDVASVHSTNAAGATVSLSFYGQAVQLFGNVTGNLQFEVNVDGQTTPGSPSGQILASISDLTQGDHTVSLTVKSPATASGGLSLASGLVIVGTGQIGATVNRTIIQDNDTSLAYGGGWFAITYDAWNIPHTDGNTTWKQLSYSDSGSVSITFSGDAIMVYGFSWSFAPTKYRITVDGQQPVLYASSSTLYSSTIGRVYSSGLLYAQTNLTGSGASHTLTFDNDNGAGQIGLDYVEIIGGSPIIPTSSASSASSPTQSNPLPTSAHRSHSVSIGVIVGPVLGFVALSLLIILAILRRKRNNVAASITPFREDEDSLRLPLGTPFQRDGGVLSRTPKAASGSTTQIMPDTNTREILSAPPQGPEGLIAKQLNGSDNSSSSPVSVVNPAVVTDNLSPITEIDAIRRDIQQLMQIVGRPGREGEAPPEYIDGTA